MRYLTGEFYWVHLLFYSFTMYLYLFFIKARAGFLIRYRNREIIVGNALFLVIVLLYYGLFYTLDPGTGLAIMVAAFLTAQVGQMSYLVTVEKTTGQIDA